MCVRKRNGNHESVDHNWLCLRRRRGAEGLGAVDPMRIATRTISGLADGATTDKPRPPSSGPSR